MSDARKMQGQEAKLSWEDWETGDRPYESAIELVRQANSIKTKAQNNIF